MNVRNEVDFLLQAFEKMEKELRDIKNNNT